MTRWRLGVCLALTLLSTACGSNAGAPPTPAASNAPSGPVLASPSPEVQRAVEAALADASAHLGLSADQLHVDQVEAHQWPDSSLGCPQAGQMYSQIVTPGYLVVVGAGGKRLEYHTDTRSRVVLCHES